MENNRRYYIVHFTGQALMKDTESEKVEKIQRRGKIHMFVENQGFVNEKFLHDKIQNDFKLSEPYIENIQELDEEDFYDFIADEYPYSTDDDPKQRGNDYEDIL